MKLGRIAAIALAVVTVGLMTGGALACVAGAPPPTSSPIPTVVYNVPATPPGQLALFAPFAAVLSGPGMVQIHLVSHQPYLQVYQLRGTGIVVSLPAEASVTMLASMHQPGEFTWVTQTMTPGSPPGVTVGILAVTAST